MYSAFVGVAVMLVWPGVHTACTVRLLVLLLCWSDQKYTRHVQSVCWCCCYAGLARSTHGVYSTFVGVAVMLVWPGVHTSLL